MNSSTKHDRAAAGAMPPGEPRAAAALYWALALAFPALLLASRHVWLVDFPDWTYQGHILHEMLFSGRTFPIYHLKPYPVPNSAPTLLLALLELAVDPETAGKLLVSLTLLGFAIVLPFLPAVRFAAQRYSRAAIGYALLALASTHWMGSVAYQMGLLLFVVYVALTARKRVAGWQLGSIATLTFLCHAVPYAGLLLLVLFEELPRPTRRLAWLLPSLALLAWYAMGTLSAHAAAPPPPPPISHVTPLRWIAWKVYSAFKLGAFQNFIMPAGTSLLERAPLAYLLLCASNAAAAGVLLYSFLWRGRAAWSGPFQRYQNFSTLLFLAFLPAPFVFLSVVNVGERILRLAVVPMLAMAPLARWPRWALLCVCAAGLVVDLAFVAGSRTEPIPSRITGSPSPSSGQDFIAQALPNTRQRLFAHKVYQGADFYARLKRGDLTVPCFSTGMIEYRPAGP